MVLLNMRSAGSFLLGSCFPWMYGLECRVVTGVQCASRRLDAILRSAEKCSTGASWVGAVISLLVWLRLNMC